MPNRRTFTLIIVTLLIAVYVVWDYKRHLKRTGIVRDFKAIPIEKAERVQKIEIANASGIIVIERVNSNGWKIKEPITDRADTKKVEGLVTALIELKKFDSITGKNSPTDSQMGLSEGSLSVKLFDSISLIGTITFGDTTGIVDTIYAHWNESDAFFCWSDIRELVEVPYDALRDNRLLNIPIEEMGKVEISDGNGASLIIQSKSEKTPWLITKPLKTNTDSEAVSEKLSAIANMASQSFIDRPDSKITAAFATSSKIISIQKRDEKTITTIQLTKSENGNFGFAKVSDRNDVVFSVEPKLIDSIGLNPNTIRDKRLMPFNPKSVVAFNISAKPNHKVSLLQDNNGWQIVENGEKTKADSQRIYKILTALATEELQAFVADAAGDLKPWGLDAPTLSITINTVALDPNNPSGKDGSPNLIDSQRKLLVKGQVAKNQEIIEYYATVKGSGTVVRLSSAFPPIVPIRPLDYKELYLWPTFNLANLQSIKTSKPPQPSLDLQYKYSTNEWTAQLANEDISAQIDTSQALKLAQHLGLPVRATRWLSKDTGDAEVALLTPSRRIEFTLTDAKGELYPFKIDIASINKKKSNLLYYARVNGKTEICLIDRQHFDILNMPLIQQSPE